MADPQNCTFIWEREFFDAATLTPGSEANQNLSVRNLQDPDRTRPWRMTGCAAESVTATFGLPRICNCLALVDHNFTPGGKITVQASNSPLFGNLLIDQEFDAWAEVLGAGELGAGEHGAWGYFLDEDRSYFVPRPIRVLYFSRLPDNDEVSAKYWRALFVDPDNPAGYLQIGTGYFSRYLEVGHQFGFGWRQSGEDPSIVNYSAGGHPSTAKREFQRVRRLPWDTFRNEDLNWRLLFMLEKVGLSQDFVLDMFPAGDPSARFFNLLYGRFRSVTEAERKYAGYAGLEMEFIESL